MNDRDVLMVEEYIRDNLPDPDVKEDEYFFGLHSYSKWAAYEILERLICESMKLPAHITGRESSSAVDIVEGFIDEMDYYSEMSSDWKTKELFSIARDEGKCVLLYICSSK